MDDFLPYLRQAFRQAHGLPLLVPPLAVPEPASRLLTWARRHRIRNLIQAEFPTADEPVPTAAYGQVQHTARYVAEAERLHGLLAHRLRFLALVKGPSLAAQAWPEPGLRIYDDLDFMCHPRDFLQLRVILKNEGYIPRARDARHLAHLWYFGWGVSFDHPNGHMVEVNHRFFPPHYPWPVRRNRSWRGQFAPQRLDEAEVQAPTPALHLLLSCLHATWHGWARLVWLVDIAGLLARHPEALGQAQALAAGSPFAELVLAVGCQAAEELLGPGLAPTARELPMTSEAESVLHLLDGTEAPLRRSHLRRFHETLMTRAEVTGYRARRLFTPGEGDFRWLSLPVGLRCLYRVVRPLRVGLYGIRLHG